MPVLIRKAREEDIPEILGIVNHSIQNSTAIYDYAERTIEQQLDWFSEKKKKGFPVLVAEIDNEITGFGTYGTFREKTGYRFTVEHSVYVSEKFHGRGAGKLLLSELIELAKLGGFHAMVGFIDAENLGSVGFHEKFGFTSSGKLNQVGFKFDRWLDVVVMQLILK